MHKEYWNALIEEIKADPSRHNQKHWTSLTGRHSQDWDSDTNEYVPSRVKLEDGELINCETTGCLAGLTGFRHAPKGTLFWRDDMKLPGEDEYIEYRDYATHILELSCEEEHYIFDEKRTWDEILEFGDLSDADREELCMDYLE